MKKILSIITSTAVIFIFVACGNGNDESNGYLTIGQLEADPFIYANGEVTVLGVVAEDDRFAFALVDSTSDFAIQVDYIGNQALPEVNSTIRVTGQILESCCDPGIALIRSLRYEVVE